MHNQFHETLWPCRGAELVLADGHRRTVPYVGPVEVRFRNRRCFTGAMVLGNEVLLGAIPMADMDLVLRPQLQSVDVNPESPIFWSVWPPLPSKKRKRRSISTRTTLL